MCECTEYKYIEAVTKQCCYAVGHRTRPTTPRSKLLSKCVLELVKANDSQYKVFNH